MRVPPTEAPPSCQSCAQQCISISVQYIIQVYLLLNLDVLHRSHKTDICKIKTRILIQWFMSVFS